MAVPVVANYFLAMGAIQALNHLLGRGANQQAFDQREAFHARQMSLEERRLVLQETQIHNAERAQRAEFQHREQMQRKGQSLDHEMRNWPLVNTPENYEALADRPHHLVMAMIPPRVPSSWSGGEIAQMYDAAVGEILGARYNPNDPVRPVTCLGGGWMRDGIRSQAALEMLHHRAPQVPVALLQVDYHHDALHLMIGCSGFSPQREEAYPVFSKSGQLSFREIGAEAARLEAEKYREALKTIEQGGSVDLTLFRTVPVNVAMANLENDLDASLTPFFQISQENLLDAVAMLEPALQIAAAGLADFFHWNRSGAIPALPGLLPSILEKFPAAIADDLTAKVLHQYEETYCFCADQAPGKDSAMRLLELAHALASPEVRKLRPGMGKSMADAAVAHFLAANHVPLGTGLIDWLKEQNTGAYRPFLKLLVKVWTAIGDETSAAELSRLLPRNVRINTG